MNREMRRFSEKEERRQKNQERKKPQRKTQGGKPGNALPIHKRIWGFLKEVRVELERVSWPTREQMIAFTTVTLITTTALTLIVFGLDLGLREGVFYLLELGR